MNTAEEVAKLIEQLKNNGVPLSDAAWEIALACEGWAYVFGAYGEYCEPSNRRSRYSSAHETIKTKCKNFNGRDSVPAGCVGCKWFLGTAKSDQSVHEGRTRFFDCRGFVYWILHYVCGMWDRCPAGATSMWNNASNWKDKGLVKDGVPDDVLICLFVQDKENKKKMNHIGFGYRGETCECSSGVQHFAKRDAKWTHWAIPNCLEGDIPDYKPTLKRGSKGEYVTLLQTKLVQRGYDIGSSGVDGSFGRATEAAVKQFQTDNGLASDGVVGRLTWDALEKSPLTSLYTVTVPSLTKYQAEGLLAQYPGSSMVKERR